MLYFAYGSNLNHFQMKKRCKDSKYIGCYKLKGYKLVFRHMYYGGGVADLDRKKNSTALGAIYKISKKDEKKLAEYEDFPLIYIKKYFKLINEAVFYGKLSPFNDIIIKRYIKKCIAQVVINEQERKGTKQFVLEMLPKYQDKKYFVDTLGHEMIHLYQMQNAGDTGNHNALFYSFQPKLKQIGLDI